MNEELKKKFERLMYQFTKMAARSSFNEFLGYVELDYEEWEEIKEEMIRVHQINEKAFYI